MRKIALFDPNGFKFTQDMVEWWRANGNEVRTDRYYDPVLVEWADLVWFDTCDNNLKSGMYPDVNDPTMAGWDMHDMDLSKKKIVTRPIDIEVWYGHQHNVDWNLIDNAIFIAPHVRDRAVESGVFANNTRTKIDVVPCGVNLDKWTFKERKPGFNIGIVSEVWESKGVDLVLQIALKLKEIDERYNIEWVGRHQDYEWDKAYTYDFIKHNKLPIKFIEYVDSVDEFLEDKNCLLHASKKEGFSYATAEAMAKGIKPILHRFYGADELWPHMTWTNIDEAVEMITSKTYDSNAYKLYLENQGYTVPQMMEKIEAIIG